MQSIRSTSLCVPPQLHAMNDDFKLKNVRMRKWLVGILLVGLFLVVMYPPSFWLCGVGVALLLTGSLANSARTDQWMSWQSEGSLNWFEGWAASTGAILTALPLVAMVIRSWLA